ncbi:methyltransferase TYW3-domain-containing protein [Hypoxylon trugodes]|uniref:methyltransferase TYW3-domain-containing protein n=1 Tax=Hypoxylon trugodes TaxID=326681 RepID=UPI00218DB8AA|nr:methyltransferase TYW3-domain-containing protein [Hypoxylon trugodes]KAI1391916.1 methyltransferase TYW3-domain-containing protein [Hypoxylon trugodes]
MRGRILPTPPPAFAQRKKRILEQLAVPDAEYADASPKGTVDVGIRGLIDVVNGLDGFVTTSSCAGRVSVFREGCKKVGGESSSADGDGNGEGEGEGARSRTTAGVGGKGGGGNWLFVSHDPVPLEGVDGAERDLEGLLGLKGGDREERGITRGDAVGDVTAMRLVHFKFEPMILHVLTASPEHAQLLLRCGLQAGFRESGAVSLTAAAGEQHATPIVAIRSMGLSFESLIGYQSGDDDSSLQCTVSPTYLRTLIGIANKRFIENAKRIARFEAALAEATGPSNTNGEEWEDAQVRRERKRAEGLKRREELQKQRQDAGAAPAVEVNTLDIPLNEDLT